MTQTNYQNNENAHKRFRIEVLFITPELGDIVESCNEDVFSWGSDNSGSFRRINFLTIDECKTPDKLREKILKYKRAGFQVVFMLARMNSTVMKTLMKITKQDMQPATEKVQNGDPFGMGENMHSMGLATGPGFGGGTHSKKAKSKKRPASVGAIQLVDMETSEERFWSLLYHPRQEIIDMVQAGEAQELWLNNKSAENVPQSFTKAIDQWRVWAAEHWSPEGEVPEQEIEPPISVSIGKEFSDWLAGLPEKVAGEVRAFLEGLAPGQTLFPAGAAGAGEIPGDASVYMFKSPQGQGMDFTGRLVRGGEEKADSFIVDTVLDDEKLMRRIQIIVATSQGQYHLAMEKKQRVKSMGNWDPFGSIGGGHDMHVTGLATGMSSPRKDKFIYEAEVQLQAGETISGFKVQIISKPDKSSGDEK